MHEKNGGQSDHAYENIAQRLGNMDHLLSLITGCIFYYSLQAEFSFGHLVLVLVYLCWPYHVRGRDLSVPRLIDDCSLQTMGTRREEPRPRWRLPSVVHNHFPRISRHEREDTYIMSTHSLDVAVRTLMFYSSRHTQCVWYRFGVQLAI